MNLETKLSKRLEFLYGESEKSALVEQIIKLIEDYGFEIHDELPKGNHWSQKDAILITYGDTILPQNGQNKLATLAEFVRNKLGDAINTIHILPFFPSSSDQGFSVMDYKEVRDDLGQWSDIERMSEEYNIMVDLVINHASRLSDWFENFQNREEPGKDYFIEVDPSTDLQNVTRPRNTPLLTAVKTNEGLRYVWTTFSDDQIDLDFSNPEVLLKFIDIFLFYISKGVRLVRLDAIAYLWKKVGTNCIHLEETHQVVKLYRDILDHIDPNVSLITETNVPFDENVSYFGDGDETHMIYQFSLPPLLLHAILTENSEYLTQWAMDLPEPPEGCTYFNFTASHDGIGVRPLEGLVPEAEFNYLIEEMRERGGLISYKKNPEGTESPYELNITYFDAFAEPGSGSSDVQVKRYLCSQIIKLGLQGVPGIYIHNLSATRNYLEGVTTTGEKRAINRKQWQKDELEEHLNNPTSISHKVLEQYKKLLEIRKKHAAFSPQAKQEILDFGKKFFVIYRYSEKAKEEILCISNISNKHQATSLLEEADVINDGDSFENLLSGERRSFKPKLEFEPYETVWLKL